MQRLESTKRYILSLVGWLGDFLNTLNRCERAIFLVGAVLAPTYFIFSQFTDLIHLLSAVAHGRQLSYTKLCLLMGETLILLWGLYLFIRFVTSKAQHSIDEEYVGFHDCVTFSHVPLHLMENEKTEELFDEAGNLKDTSGISVDDKIFLENLPTALAFLRDKASMADMYHRGHDPEPVAEAATQRTVTLLELLNEAKAAASSPDSPF